MTVIADNKRRVTLPRIVQAGDAFDVKQEGTRFVLVKLERPAAPKPGKVTFHKRRGRYPVASVAGAAPITFASVKAALEDFP